MVISFLFSFQFFTRLAAVFAEEVGGFDSLMILLAASSVVFSRFRPDQIPHSTTSCSMFIVFSPMVIFQAIHCSPRSHLSIANFLVLLSQSRGTLEPYRSPK